MLALSCLYNIALVTLCLFDSHLDLFTLSLYIQPDDEDEPNFPMISAGGPIRPPSPFLIVANKILKGPVILNVGGKK